MDDKESITCFALTFFIETNEDARQLKTKILNEAKNDFSKIAETYENVQTAFLKKKPDTEIFWKL